MHTEVDLALSGMEGAFGIKIFLTGLGNAEFFVQKNARDGPVYGIYNTFDEFGRFFGYQVHKKELGRRINENIAIFVNDFVVSEEPGALVFADPCGDLYILLHLDGLVEDDAPVGYDECQIKCLQGKYEYAQHVSVSYGYVLKYIEKLREFQIPVEIDVCVCYCVFPGEGLYLGGEFFLFVHCITSDHKLLLKELYYIFRHNAI